MACPAITGARLWLPRGRAPRVALVERERGKVAAAVRLRGAKGSVGRSATLGRAPTATNASSLTIGVGPRRGPPRGLAPLAAAVTGRVPPPLAGEEMPGEVPQDATVTAAAGLPPLVTRGGTTVVGPPLRRGKPGSTAGSASTGSSARVGTETSARGSTQGPQRHPRRSGAREGGLPLRREGVRAVRRGLRAPRCRV